MTPNEIFEQFKSGFPARKFSAGLLIAFIDFFEELATPSLGKHSLDNMLEEFPRQTVTSQGKMANTLIVGRHDGSTLSLRPFYNNAEKLLRDDHKRFDYPKCAPHATQAWQDYRPWLDSLVGFSSADLNSLRQEVVDFVLTTLKSHEFDPASVTIEPPLLRLLLEEFDLTAKQGEPTGASYQGLIFGFLRADNPHLQIEIRKVRTGSRRVQGVGDIDAWEGARLAITAEVKQRVLKTEHLHQFEAFADEVARRGSIGMVVALEFGDDGIRDGLEGLGLRSLDRADLLRIVELWDPLKQRTAAQSFLYYASHVEQNSSLADRLDKFLKDVYAAEQ